MQNGREIIQYAETTEMYIIVLLVLIIGYFYIQYQKKKLIKQLNEQQVNYEMRLRDLERIHEDELKAILNEDIKAMTQGAVTNLKAELFDKLTEQNTIAKKKNLDKETIAVCNKQFNEDWENGNMEKFLKEYKKEHPEDFVDGIDTDTKLK